MSYYCKKCGKRNEYPQYDLCKSCYYEEQEEEEEDYYDELPTEGFDECIICGRSTKGYAYCKRCYNRYTEEDLLYMLNDYIRENEEYYDDDEDDELYSEKSAMTETETKFWHRLKRLYGKRFIITPQVALCSIIQKNYDYYANELFRIIDFGIFTKKDYEIVALIELNDNSHYRHDRKERDRKVKSILEEAGLIDKFITFWTSMENSDQYIRQRIDEVLYADEDDEDDFPF